MAEKKVPQNDSVELRRVAEERLGESPELEPRSVGEAQRLLHELQVYQVELEMQNAELCKFREAMETVLDKYTELYDFAPMSYFTLDRKGIICSVNLTGSRLLRIERSRLGGRRFEHFVAAESRPAFAAFLEKVFTSLDKERCAIALKNRLFVQLEAVASGSGQECLIVLIDFTEHKRLEEALKKEKETAEALRKVTAAAEVALRKVEAAANVAFRTEKETDVLRKEKGAEEALGMVKEAAAIAFLKVEEAAEVALRAEKGEPGLLRPAKEAAEALRKVKEASEEARRKVENAAEVALRMVKETAEALLKGEKATGVLRLQKELAEATAQTKSQFLANMSHELRTPMTGILGMLQIALEEEIAPELRGYLETALRSIRSLLQVLNDILDMAKIEAGKLIFEEKPFSLQKCITEALDIIIHEVRRKGLDLDISIAGEIPDTVIGDQLRLRQVIINLISNAVKFTEGGKVAVQLTAGGATSHGEREFTFSVTDTGIGIPDDKKELLFLAFSQVDASHSRSFGGTGLGLAISREIIEQMGGTISFESEEGVGSIFSFTVPLASARLQSATLSASAPQPAKTGTPVPEGEKGQRLLLAEDDATIREVLGLMLKRSNYQVDFAEDGLKTIEMWEKGEYDLVLMDVQMPRLNGFEATRAIRERERERGGYTPIVAMTAHAFEEDKGKCLAAGMDNYISKPIDFERTRKMIAESIKKKSSVPGDR